MKILLMVIVLGLGFPVFAHADFLDDYAFYSAEVLGNHYAEQRYYRQREIDRLFYRERAVAPPVVVVPQVAPRRRPVQCYTYGTPGTRYYGVTCY